jgi:hypothetical protein
MPTDDDPDELIEQITVDAYGDEGYWSFRQAFEDEVMFPLAATLIGIPISVAAIDFDGDERRGLVAVVQRDAKRTAISLLDIEIPPSQQTADRLVAAYRRWLGMT